MEAAGIESEVANQQPVIPSEVALEPEPLGVFRECSNSSNCRCMSFDVRLKSIIAVWDTLPESIKKEMEAMCLQAPSC